MIRAAVLALCLASPALAGICADPVENGQPAPGIETGQPTRMASEVRTYPGYPYLVISPTNRSQLYTIRDGRFEPLDADFPRVGVWQFRDVFERRDGSLIGFGRNPNIPYRLTPGNDRFMPVPIFEPYANAFYDPETDTALLRLRNGRLYELTDDGIIPSSRPHVPGLGVYQRFVPALGGSIATGQGDLWFLPEGGATWTRVPGMTDLSDQFYRFATSDVVVNPAAQIAQIRLKRSLVVLDISGVTPQHLYTVEDAGSHHHVNGAMLIEIRNYGRTLFGRKRYSDRRWPDLRILTRDGPKPIPGAPEIIPADSNIAPFHFKNMPTFGVVLVWINDSFWVFDGRGLSPAPAHMTLPRLSWTPLGDDDRYWGNSRALWRLDDGLRTTPVPLPSGEAYYRMTPSAAFGGAFLVADGSAWFSADMARFAPVSTPPGAALIEVVSDMPDEKAALAVGKGGLYLLRDCD